MSPNPASFKPLNAQNQGIPSMLRYFQSEWDAIILETYTLKQQLNSSQKELSHVLYQQDAACRVIARLIKERDQYKNELAEFRSKGSSTVNGMEIDLEKTLPEEFKERIEKAKAELTALRSVRKIGPQVATRSQVSTIKLSNSYPLHKSNQPEILCVDINPEKQNLIVTGGVDTTAVIFDKQSGQKIAVLSAHTKPVTFVKFHQNKIVTSGEDGHLIVWIEKNLVWEPIHNIKVHSAPIVAFDIHPIGDLIVTASKDRSFCFVDIVSGKILIKHKDASKLEMGLTCVQFHPDGEIMATGNEDNNIQMWDVKTLSNLATFEGHTGKISDLCFSENGYSLASSSFDQTIKIWDLQQVGSVKTLPLDVVPSKISYDFSGRFLAVACGNEIRVLTGKNLDLVENFDEHKKQVTSIKWGKNAQFFVTTSLDRTLKIWEL